MVENGSNSIIRRCSPVERCRVRDRRLLVLAALFLLGTPVARAEPQPTAPANRVPESYRKEEATLIEAMVLDREVSLLVEHRGVLDNFSSSVLATAGHAILDALNRNADPASALDDLPAELATHVTAGLLGQGPIAGGDRLQVARDCIDRIEQRKVGRQKREHLLKLRQAEASGDEACTSTGGATRSSPPKPLPAPCKA